VTKNLALARARNTARREELLHENRELIGRQPDSAAAAHGEPTDRGLEEALAAMAQEHREVLLMRVVDGMSVAEVALALGIPDGTVKSRLHHALKVLRDAGIGGD